MFHDWPDKKKCMQIFRHIAAAMQLGYWKIPICVEGSRRFDAASIDGSEYAGYYFGTGKGAEAVVVNYREVNP